MGDRVVIDPNDPFHARTTDDAFEIRNLHGLRQRVLGPYRHRASADRELRLLPNGFEIVAVVYNCRCDDEPPDTPESEWQK